MSSDTVAFRRMQSEDIVLLAAAFVNYKPKERFEALFQSQQADAVDVWIVTVQDAIAGYVTILWQSRLDAFKREAIPEISDLNILPQYRRKAIATQLLDHVEEVVRARSPTAGIGVGVTAEYAVPHRLYLQRGYLPCTMGVTYHYQPVTHGSPVCVDDDLVLWFTKPLNAGIAVDSACP